MDPQLVETALKSVDDIALPPPVSYMPQTWGWAAVALVLLALLAVLFWRWHRHRVANRYRRAALAELRLLEQRPADQADGADLVLHGVAGILKRTAIAAWPRRDVASLSGSTWVQFLTDHAPQGTLDELLIQLLDEREYQRPLPLTADQNAKLRAAARRWIEGHHVSA
jgi:hypothetical protein